MMIEAIVVEIIQSNIAKLTKKANLKYPPLSIIYSLKIVKSIFPTVWSSGSISCYTILSLTYFISLLFEDFPLITYLSLTISFYNSF